MEKERTKLTPAQVQRMKGKKKICMLTAYDFPSAVFLEEAGVDIMLVGDSLGNVILGYKDTWPVTMEDMLHHTKAVRQGAKSTFLVADFPKNGFDGDAFENAQRLIREGGAEALKIEGEAHLNLIRKLVKAQVPVMGHLGHTPQTMTKPVLHGKSEEEARELMQAAKNLQSAGVFALVLELVEPSLAQKITRAVRIPTIGIGSGDACDGQVLVTHDLVGLYPRPVPKFVKPYADLGRLFKKAIIKYIADVKKARL